MSRRENKYTDLEQSLGADSPVQNEMLKAAAQSEAEETVVEALTADALIAMVTQEPPTDDQQALLLLHGSLDGPQFMMRSSGSTGYSRRDYPRISVRSTA